MRKREREEEKNGCLIFHHLVDHNVVKNIELLRHEFKLSLLGFLEFDLRFDVLFLPSIVYRHYRNRREKRSYAIYMEVRYLDILYVTFWREASIFGISD